MALITEVLPDIPPRALTLAYVPEKAPGLVGTGEWL